MSYGTQYMQEGYEGVPGPLAPAVKESMEQVEYASRVYGFSDFIIKTEEISFYEKSAIIVDADFFEIFSYLFHSGSKTALFSDPYNIAITQEMAEKYFGQDDPIGQELKLDDFEMTIAAVLKDLPKNSHIQTGFL